MTNSHCQTVYWTERNLAKETDHQNNKLVNSFQKRQNCTERFGTKLVMVMLPNERTTDNYMWWYCFVILDLVLRNNCGIRCIQLPAFGTWQPIEREKQSKRNQFENNKRAVYSQNVINRTIIAFAVKQFNSFGYKWNRACLRSLTHTHQYTRSTRILWFCSHTISI